MGERLFRVVGVHGCAMKPITDLPDGLLAVPFGKGCVLLLTPQEVTAGIRRGKWWKRRQAELTREATSPLAPVVASKTTDAA